jgi:RNA polymerase sigma-32 factor
MARKRESEAPTKGKPKARRQPAAEKKAAAKKAASQNDAEESVEVEAELVDEEEIADEESIDETEAQAYDDDIGEPEGELVPPSSVSTTALSLRDPFQAYIREVQRYKLLTPDEEKTLTREYAETQDPEIARRLVTANLRLVIKLAYEYRRAYKNMMDLIQEGNIGLMQAVKRYDPYRGVKLSSYSAWWIRAYMLRFILNNWRLVKLGTTQAQRKLFFNLNKQKAKLAAMGIDPTPKLIANRLGVKEKEVVEMDRRLSSSEASLDAPLGDSEGRSVARVELMPSEDRSTDDRVAGRELEGCSTSTSSASAPASAAKTSRSSTSAWSPKIRSPCRSWATSSASPASVSASSRRASPASCATTSRPSSATPSTSASEAAAIMSVTERR